MYVSMRGTNYCVGYEGQWGATCSFGGQWVNGYKQRTMCFCEYVNHILMRHFLMSLVVIIYGSLLVSVLSPFISTVCIQENKPHSWPAYTISRGLSATISIVKGEKSWVKQCRKIFLGPVCLSPSCTRQRCVQQIIRE